MELYEVSWDYLMNAIVNGGYSTSVHYNEDEDDENYDDNGVVCPECEEIVYEEDYPNVKTDGKYVYCPICEAAFQFD